jgi:hypothetical protein
MLTPAAMARYEYHAYRFCANERCPVVYFAEDGTTFRTSDIRERVWQKERSGGRTVCYCFGENEADLTAEIERGGHSLAVERIRGHIVAARCACWNSMLSAKPCANI